MFHEIFNILREILSLLLEIRTDLKILLPVQAKEEDLLLDNSDAKRLLKIGDSTLYRWCKSNRLTFRVIGNKRYYLKSDLIKMINDPV